MKNKNLLILGLLTVSPLTKADTSCIGITTVNPVTFVSEQHPLGFVNCPCNCSNSRHLENSTCITCAHKHANSQVIQTAKTNGNFVNFMPPPQATSSCPTCPATDWVTTLLRHVKEQEDNRLPKEEFSSTAPYSEARNI
jgi:hypothetical protein